MAAIYELSTNDVLILAELLTRADAENRTVRVAIDSGLKVKVGEGMWTAPLGTRDR